MRKPVRMRLGDLRLAEDFMTISGRIGRTIDTGHVRPSGWSAEKHEMPRPRWRAVLCDLEGSPGPVALSPELVVLVSADRPHLSADRIRENRWAQFLRTEGEEGEAA